MATEKRLIDMEDALRRMEKAEHLMHKINGIKAVDIGALRQFFGMLKPVDAVEVVHGRWKVSRESEISRNVWCTACGKDFYMHRKGELQIDKMPYCPNCGAKMDGDGNG